MKGVEEEEQVQLTSLLSTHLAAEDVLWWSRGHVHDCSVLLLLLLLRRSFVLQRHQHSGNEL